MLSINSILFISLAIVFSTSARIITRYVLRKTDPYAYSLLTNIVAALIWIPLALATWKLPVGITPWIIVSIAGILWAGLSVSDYIAYKGTDLSIKVPLGQSKLFWGLLIAIFFLHESPTIYRIIGIVIIFIGVCLLLWHPERKFIDISDSGVRWTLGVAAFSAIVSSIDKYAMQSFSPETYGFFVYLIPATILGAFYPRNKHKVKNLLKLHGKLTILAIVLSTAGYYFVLKSFSTTDFTIAYPLLQLSTLFTVLGGVMLLKEHQHAVQRIIATLIVVIGAILVGF